MTQITVWNKPIRLELLERLFATTSSVTVLQSELSTYLCNVVVTCNETTTVTSFTARDNGRCHVIQIILHPYCCDISALFTYSLTFLLTPWNTVLLEKQTGYQLVKKFPAFYGTRRFITAFTSARHLPLSWARSIQSMLPHSTSWRSVLMLSSHLHLRLPSGLFPSSFPTETLHIPLLSTINTSLLQA